MSVIKPAIETKIIVMGIGGSEMSKPMYTKLYYAQKNVHLITLYLVRRKKCKALSDFTNFMCKTKVQENSNINSYIIYEC